MQNQNNSYNNADSFAMIFDEAWKKNNFSNNKELTTKEKINKIIEQNKDHPFIQSSPSKEQLHQLLPRIQSGQY